MVHAPTQETYDRAVEALEGSGSVPKGDRAAIVRDDVVLPVLREMGLGDVEHDPNDPDAFRETLERVLPEAAEEYELRDAPGGYTASMVEDPRLGVYSTPGQAVAEALLAWVRRNHPPRPSGPSPV